MKKLILTVITMLFLTHNTNAQYNPYYHNAYQYELQRQQQLYLYQLQLRQRQNILLNRQFRQPLYNPFFYYRNRRSLDLFFEQRLLRRIW